MGWKKLTFLLFASQFLSIAVSSTIETLNEGEGLRFEEIGDFQLITQLHELKFNVNLTEISELINASEEAIEEAFKFEKKDLKYNLTLKQMLKIIKQQKELYVDIFYSLNSEEKKRTKRSTDLLSGAVYLLKGIDKEYQKEVDDVRDRVNDAKIATYHLNKKYVDAVKIQNGTNYNLTKQIILNEIGLRVHVVKSKIRAILSMQQRRRLSSVFVNITIFTESLENLTKFIGHDEEKPFKKINEYFYSLEMTHRVEGQNMILTVQVPIVEKSMRKLHKIHELPSYVGTHLLITDVEWKYLAVGKKDVVKMKSLDKCLKGATPNSYFCDFQSPIMNLNDNSDCLIHALDKREINFSACKTTAAHFSQLIFIKLGNGEYFYYKPQPDEISVIITCNGKLKTVKVLKNKTGILMLEQGCSASTDKNRLISTRTSSTLVSSSIKVGFSDSRLGQSLEELLESFKQSDYLKQREEILSKMNNNKTPPPAHNSRSQIAGGDIALIALASLVCLVIVVIAVKEIVTRKCLNKKKEDDTIKIIVET